MAAVAAIALTGVWMYLIGFHALRIIGRHLLGARNQRGGADLKELLLTAPFASLLERMKLYERLQLQLGSYHMKLFILNGADWTMDRTKKSAAAACGNGFAAIAGCSWLAWLAAEQVMLGMGLVLGVVLAIRPYISASREIEKRRRLIIMELPIMMSKLMLLVGAGETVQGALVRCLDGKQPDNHPLYKEWRGAMDALRNGHPFHMALERFNRRCAVQEASVFTTVLLLNYRKGGEHFVLALRELSYSLWEKRKAAARARGEEASSKLVFPLVGILLVLMVLVAAPAVLLMG